MSCKKPGHGVATASGLAELKVHRLFWDGGEGRAVGVFGDVGVSNAEEIVFFATNIPSKTALDPVS